MDLQGIPFTNVYRSMLTSSIWTTPHPHLHMIRCVWMTLMLMADRRGYVHSSVPGLAAAALVSIEEAEEALELFRGPDKYSRTKSFEGRRIMNVEGGWLLLNYEAHRDATVQELAKQAKRDSYHRNKGKNAQGDADARQSDPNSETFGDDRQGAGIDGSPLDDASSRALSSSSLLETDQDRSLEEPDQVESRSAGPVGGTRRGTVDHLDGWSPKPELYARAAELGLSREIVDQRIGELRTGPVGGARGVFPNKRDEYVLQQLPKWRTWKETDAAKAARAAAAPVGRRLPGDDITTTEAATVFHPTNEHRDFCRSHKLDLDHAVSEFRKGTRPGKLGTLPAQSEFTHRLKCWAATGVFYADGPMPKASPRAGAA